MTAQGIKAGEEHLYVLYVVANSISGWFWHDMVWSEDPEIGGFWEPNCDRSICKFKTREEAIRNMRVEVPHIMDSDEFKEVPSGDGEMLFRKRYARIRWYKSGQKMLECDWKPVHGWLEKHGVWTLWYENGQKEWEETYLDGKLDGLYTSWYENGQKKAQGTYKAVEDSEWMLEARKANPNYRPVLVGREEGVWTTWYENGQKSSEGTFKDGKPDGVFTYWDEQGNFNGVETCKDGVWDEFPQYRRG